MLHRPHTLRHALAWLLVAVLLPVGVAGAVVLSREWTRQRELAREHLRDHAKSIRRAVDRELALDQAVLSALAGSREIDERDWRAFHAAAVRATAVRPGSWFVLFDRSGRVIVNTSVPFGTPLPNFRDLLATGAALDWNGRKLPLPGSFLFTPFETGHPSFSGLFYGPTNRKPVVASTVPVLRGGAVRYVLALAYGPDFYVRLVQAERSPDELVTALFDGDGLFIARNQDPERFVARRGPAPFDGSRRDLPKDGVGEAVSVDDVPFVYAYSRSSTNGWVAVAGKARAQVFAPAWHALWLWLGILASAAAVGSMLGVRLWRRLTTPLATLARHARSPGELHVPVAPSGLEEVDALARALQDAARNEQARGEAERDREAARHELRHSEERLREIFDDAAVGIMEIDRYDRLVAVNARFCQMLGYAREELVGKGIGEITAPEDAGITRDLSTKAHAGNARVFDYEKRYLRRDGAPLWVHVTVSIVKDDGGRFVRAIGTAEDITERRRAQEALRESEEKFRSVFEQAALGMGRVSFSDARWIDVNEAFCRMLGYTRGQLLATPWPEMTHPEDVEADLIPFHRMAAGELDSYTVDKRFVHADGHHVWARLTLSLVRDADHRPSYEIAIIEDIGAQKRAEQALREADRRKDEFLGMLSHELRNPLAPIRNSSYVLKHADPASERADRARRVIERQADHLTRIVDDLLDVTRIARGKILLQPSRIDLRELVARSADDVRLTTEERQVALRVELPQERLWAHADPTRVTQVLGNLLQNAVKFTSAGGAIRITLRQVDATAEIAVRDTGTGVDPELLPHLFDAFVQGKRTLARSEGGLGLGLALVKALVEQHGGSVRARSDGIGHGAEFTVTLPLAEQDGTDHPAERGFDARATTRPGADEIEPLLS